MSIITTDQGQISVDFLMGISVFLLSLGFVIQFIPGLFTSISGEGSLNSAAYRTAAILTDDPGWWENNTHNGTDWEMHTGNISRIGLAMDNTPGTRQTRTPNMLNRIKIQQALQLNETMLTNKLGLYDKINGIQVDYGYNITLEKNGNPMVINGSNTTFGKMLPASQDIFKTTRQVLVETGGMAIFRFDELTAMNLPNDKANINISGPQSEDVIIQIIDFNISDPDAAKINDAKLINPVRNLAIPEDFTVFKKTNTSDFVYSTTINIDLKNSTDSLRLIFNRSLFQENRTLQLNFGGMNFTLTGPPYIEYSDKVEPLYEAASLVVMVWK